MRIDPELGGCSIVLLGSFNPAIFSPDWLERYGVITRRELEAAEIGMIHPELAAFTVGTKVMQVELGRFSVETAEAPWVSLSDFVVKIFGELLSHTPISRIGINRMVHFGVETEENRNRIGKMLAPTAPWGEWGKIIDDSPRERRGGFRRLVMQEPETKASDIGSIQATVEPSTRISGNAGI